MCSKLMDLDEIIKKISIQQSQLDNPTQNYVNRLKKCYQKINDIINKTKNEKFIVEGQDIYGDKQKGISSETIENSFIGIVKQSTPYSDICKNKLLIDHYINHSLCSQDFLDDKNKVKININIVIDNHGDLEMKKNLYFEEGFKSYSIDKFNTELYQYNIMKDMSSVQGRKWDGKSFLRPYTFNPSICQYIIDKAQNITKIFPQELYQDGGVFRIFNYDFTNWVKNNKSCYSIFELYSNKRLNDYLFFNSSKKILLSYLLDKHETIRPHPEFIKRSEHQYVASNILLKRLYKLTKNYYILGEMKNSKLESIEKILEEITN